MVRGWGELRPLISRFRDFASFKPGVKRVARATEKSGRLVGCVLWQDRGCWALCITLRLSSMTQPVTPPTEKKAMLSVRVDRATLAAFDALAEGRGGRSALLRSLLAQAMSQVGSAPIVAPRAEPESSLGLSVYRLRGSTPAATNASRCRSTVWRSSADDTRIYPTNMYDKPLKASCRILRQSDRVCRLFCGRLLVSISEGECTERQKPNALRQQRGLDQSGNDGHLQATCSPPLSRRHCHSNDRYPLKPCRFGL